MFRGGGKQCRGACSEVLPEEIKEAVPGLALVVATAQMGSTTTRRDDVATALRWPASRRSAVNARTRATQANEGDWVQCKSVAHFTTAPRFIDVHVIRTLSCYLIRATEAKYLLGRAQHVFGTQKLVHKTGFLFGRAKKDS